MAAATESSVSQRIATASRPQRTARVMTGRTRRLLVARMVVYRMGMAKPRRARVVGSEAALPRRRQRLRLVGVGKKCG